MKVMETKTKRNLVIWSIVLLVVLNISSLATIWYHRYQFRKENRAERFERRGRNMPDGAPHRFRQMPPFLTETLDLSEKQHHDLDSIWFHYNNQRRLLEDSMNRIRAEMFNILMEKSLDSGLYENLSGQQTRLLKELNDTMLEMNRTIRDNLSEDQQNAYAEKMEEMRNKMSRERRQRTRK